VLEREKRSPFASGGGDLFRIRSIRTEQRHEITGLRRQIRWIERARGAQLLDSRIDVSAPKLVQAKVITNDMIVWLQIPRALIARHRDVEIAQLAGDISQHEPRYVGIWVELRSSFKKRLRCRCAIALSLLQTFVDKCVSTGRRCRGSFGACNDFLRSRPTYEDRPEAP
jgi:hypothetical protein